MQAERSRHALNALWGEGQDNVGCQSARHRMLGASASRTDKAGARQWTWQVHGEEGSHNAGAAKGVANQRAKHPLKHRHAHLRK